MERIPKMKANWITVIGLAGIVLFSGDVFGGELQWKTPGGSVPVRPKSSVLRVPPALKQSALVQVQAVIPADPIQPAPALAPQLSDRYLELRPEQLPVPPGAELQKVPVQTEFPSAVLPETSSLGTAESVPCSGPQLKSIRDISPDIRLQTPGNVPPECEVSNVPFDGRHFSQTCMQWKASALCTKGAYFEDVQLERYGNTIVCPELQPMVSGVKFLANTVLLPYKMGVTPPDECVYTLGYYRPGNRTPYMVQPFPLSLRGALFEAGAVVGGAAIIP